MHRTHKRDEQGATLIIVLVFITVFGLILAGLLTQGDASLQYTNTVSAHEAKVYAADAGVSAVIQQLRQNNERCPAPGTTGPPIPPLTINGRTVNVTCSTLSGATVGAAGYAVITTLNGPNSLLLDPAVSKHITGPVYINGQVGWGPGLQVTDGNFYQGANGTTCTTPTSSQLSFVTATGAPEPQYGYYCTPIPLPNPPHNPPTVIPSTAPNNPPRRADGCQVWYPGLYTSPPALVPGDNYFASGVYYFNFNGSWDIKQSTVYGGQPSNFEKGQELLGGVSFSDGQTTSGSATFTSASANFTSADVGRRISGPNIPSSTTIAGFVNSTTVTLSSEATGTGTGLSFTIVRPPACAQQDPTGVPGVSGNGVEFVFGGNASMYIDTQGGVELFSRQGEAAPATSNVSLVGVPNDGTWPTGPTGWSPSTLPASTPVVDMKTGDPQRFAIHGLLYAPNDALRLYATNSVISVASGGVVSKTLEMQSSASASGPVVSIPSVAPTPRQVVITATAQGLSAGEKPVTSTAVVQLGSDASKTVTVQSWRTPGPTDP
jgi:hypothetical protein